MEEVGAKSRVYSSKLSEAYLMLYIKQKEINSLLVRESTWHVGQPLPHISRPVVTFQADGDELRVILKALHEHSKQPPAMPIVESPGD